MSNASLSSHSANSVAANVTANSFAHPDQFVNRHIGPNAEAQTKMLGVLGYKTLPALIDAAVPQYERR